MDFHNIWYVLIWHCGDLLRNYLRANFINFWQLIVRNMIMAGYYRFMFYVNGEVLHDIYVISLQKKKKQQQMNNMGKRPLCHM